MTIVLPKGIPTRWQQAIAHDDLREWSSLAFYMRTLSRRAWADNSFCMANDLLMLAQVAHQRAIDLEPKKEAA
jgi:hypothetical protein